MRRCCPTSASSRRSARPRRADRTRWRPRTTGWALPEAGQTAHPRPPVRAHRSIGTTAPRWPTTTPISATATTGTTRARAARPAIVATTTTRTKPARRTLAATYGQEPATTAGVRPLDGRWAIHRMSSMTTRGATPAAPVPRTWAGPWIADAPALARSTTCTPCRRCSRWRAASSPSASPWSPPTATPTGMWWRAPTPPPLRPTRPSPWSSTRRWAAARSSTSPWTSWSTG